MHHKFEREMEQTDQYLLELAVRGDGGSFGQLMERWDRKIFGFIRRYVGNREDAEDLTQNTFVKAFQNLGSLSNPSHFASWLYKIALNECRMTFRKQKGRTAVSLEDSQPEVDDRTREEISPERTLEGREKVSRLEEAFRKLPVEQREVLLMKEFQGLRFQDIADVLGIPVSTAKSRLYLGLKSLRCVLENEDEL